LLARQAEINSLLDLDKGDHQGADSSSGLKNETDIGGTAPAAPRGRDEVAKIAEAYMPASGTAFREMPISERTPQLRGLVTGRAVAKDGAHIAVATAPNSFVVVEATLLAGQVQESAKRLSLRPHQGPCVDQPKNGGSLYAWNREVVMIVQHEQRNGCR
jgi:hypothetical protein